MLVKVTHISNSWKPIKVGVEDGYNMVVVTQALEAAALNGVVVKIGGTLRLNLNSEQPNKQDWLKVLKEGNVLNVQLRQTGKVVAVDKYKSPTITKKVENGTQAKDVE